MNREDIVKYVNANGISEGWKSLADRFGFVSVDAATSYYKRNKNKVQAKNTFEWNEFIPDTIVENKGVQEKKEDFSNGTTEIKFHHTSEVLGEDEIWKETKMDRSKWKFVQIYHKKFGRGFLYTANFRAKDDKDNFEENLLQSLKRSLSNITKYSPFKQAKFIPASNKALFVYLADDHAGIDFKTSMFGGEFNASIYKKRLSSLAGEILNLKADFDHLFIVNLGDEMDGFNAKTTRDGHSLDSLSNEEQFDIYTSARKEFYDNLLMSSKFPATTVVSLNNSNHTGLGYSYMVNKALEFYLEARYNNISFIYQKAFIDTYIWGDHMLALTHGKDEKYMKAPMPLNLDNKTDLYLMDLFRGSKAKYFSTIKGDLHAYSVNIGKSGRYVNVPSICGGSTWIEHNFGSSNPGALLEIVEKTNKNIQSIPIWF